MKASSSDNSIKAGRFLLAACVMDNWHSRRHWHWSVIVSFILHVQTPKKAFEEIHHASVAHYTSPSSPVMRNQVLWKNPYAQPVITFEESSGGASMRERHWAQESFKHDAEYIAKVLVKTNTFNLFYEAFIWQTNTKQNIGHPIHQYPKINPVPINTHY